MVDPLSVEVIAAGMLKVIGNVSLSEEMRAIDFSWEKCMRQILDMIERI